MENQNYSSNELKQFFRFVQKLFETSTELRKIETSGNWEETQQTRDLEKTCKNLEWYILKFLDERAGIKESLPTSPERKIIEKVNQIQMAEISIDIWKDEVFKLEQKILERNIRV